MVNRTLLCIAFIYFLFALGRAFGQTSGKDSIEVWAVPAEQKVRPNDRSSDADYAHLIWNPVSKIVSVAGAKNEHVPFQVVISAPIGQDEEPASGFFMEVSDLSSSSGSIANDQVNLYLEYYILVYAKSGPMGATGFWPDALPPLTDPFRMTAWGGEEPVRTRAVWIDIDVPNDVPAGTYTGTLTVTQHGTPIDELNLSLQVYDFALPDKSHLVTHINLSSGRLARFYGLDPASREFKELFRTYYDFLYAHRMEPWFHDPLQPEITEAEDGGVTVHFDEEDYDYYMNELKTHRVVLEAAPGELREDANHSLFSEAFNQRIESYLQQVYQFYREHGWADRLVFNSPIDEPSSKQEYAETRQWAKLVHQTVPGVPFLATETPVTEDPDWGTLRGTVNNFSIHGNELARRPVKEAIQEVKKSGGEVTWYISCDQGYPQPNYFIDAPAMDPVMVPWITARYGMDGILYWATIWWGETSNPWWDPVTFLTGYGCSGGYTLNGEGSLLYPGNLAEEFTEQNDVYGPVSSIRFELLREGIEDYEYFQLLDSLGAEEFVEEIVESMVVGVRSFSRSVADLYAKRGRMAERIEALSQ